jgi:hypothetical protein
VRGRNGWGLVSDAARRIQQASALADAIGRLLDHQRLHLENQERLKFERRGKRTDVERSSNGNGIKSQKHGYPEWIA